MAELFGFRITRANQGGGSDGFTSPTSDDGTLDVVSGGGHYASILDMDGRDRNEIDLIRRYRDIAMQPECDSAIEDITNEAIVSDERDQSVSIQLDRLDVSQNIKGKIREEFNEVLALLDFNSKGHDIFRRWYVDGRIYYHKIIDPKNPRKGIKEVRYIDPRKIKKVRETQKDNPNRKKQRQKMQEKLTKTKNKRTKKTEKEERRKERKGRKKERKEERTGKKGKNGKIYGVQKGNERPRKRKIEEIVQTGKMGI